MSSVSYLFTKLASDTEEKSAPRHRGTALFEGGAAGLGLGALAALTMSGIAKRRNKRIDAAAAEAVNKYVSNEKNNLRNVAKKVVDSEARRYADIKENIIRKNEKLREVAEEIVRKRKNTSGIDDVLRNINEEIAAKREKEIASALGGVQKDMNVDDVFNRYLGFESIKKKMDAGAKAVADPILAGKKNYKHLKYVLPIGGALGGGIAGGNVDIEKDSGVNVEKKMVKVSYVFSKHASGDIIEMRLGDKGVYDSVYNIDANTKRRNNSGLGALPPKGRTCGFKMNKGMMLAALIGAPFLGAALYGGLRKKDKKNIEKRSYIAKSALFGFGAKKTINAAIKASQAAARKKEMDFVSGVMKNRGPAPKLKYFESKLPELDDVRGRSAGFYKKTI